ncbi:hypothetical protein KKE19_03420 [Patescibacteria group bacterium]|nr:hypothetical protein [Patescibacteria group bacterium]MBU4367806.1 hypothetical protein [Patescibacteria group bacterium]MBU4462184.1 hypothetical protein [Patescibacteria group bacterium]MCG2699945.1 hypothetical protein [Candidatus Parcubacteria bacterium]
MNEEKREKFLKVYYNLPLKVREEPIYDLDGKPLSWNAVYIEIKGRTKIGEAILDKLTELKII